MPVSSQVVRFNKSTGASGTTQDVALTFTPKAIIVMSDGGAGADATLEAEYQLCYGFSDGTNQTCMAVGSDDASAASDTGRLHRNDSIFARLSTDTPATTTVCRGTCIFQTNNVRFTWVTNDAVATKIVMWAIGGSDITNVKVATGTTGRTTAGTTDYTGLGFTPLGDGHTALFMFGISGSSAGFNTNATIASSNISVATKPAGAPYVDYFKQWNIVLECENAADPSDTWRTSNTDRNFANFNGAGGYFEYGYLEAWITDGFRMMWDGAPPSAIDSFGYLVINGGNWDSGTFTSPTSALTDQTYNVSVDSGTIRGLMLSSTGSLSTTVINTQALYSIGVTDGTNHAVIASIDEDAQATMDSYRFHASTSILYLMTLNGVLTDRATFDIFGTNTFRLDYPAKSGNAQLYHWVVLADTPATFTLFDRPISDTSISVSESLTRVPVRVRSISDTSISVSEALSRIQTLIKTISDTSVTVSETLARVAKGVRPISDTSITVSETLARIQTTVRSISDTSISVSETLTRLAIFFRSISDPSVSVSETLTRLQTLIRSISDPSITVSDAVISGLSFNRPINEAAISVSESVARLPLYIRPISESGITVSDSLLRWIAVSYTLSEPTINVSESLVGQLFYLRTISESAITTSETLARLLAATRNISEGSISISDLVTRTQSIIKQISESTISVSDALQGSLLFTALLIESRIKWYYSVLTRKIGA